MVYTIDMKTYTMHEILYQYKEILEQDPQEMLEYELTHIDEDSTNL